MFNPERRKSSETDQKVDVLINELVGSIADDKRTELSRKQGEASDGLKSLYEQAKILLAKLDLDPDRKASLNETIAELEADYYNLG